MKIPAITYLFALLSIFICSKCSLADNKAPLKVGVIVPLSGPVASMGEAFRKGIEISQRDAADKQVQFIFEDSKYEGKTSVTALHKLRSTHEIDLAIVWGNTPSGSCAPVADQQKIPVLAVSMNPDAKGRKFVVSIGPKTESFVERVAEQLSRWDLRKPAAVTVDLGNALRVVEMIKEKRNDNLLIRTLANEEADFKTLIASLKSRGFDGLVLFALPEQALTFLKQARDLHYTPKIVGGDVFADASFQEKALALSQDLVFAYAAVDKDFIQSLACAKGPASYFFEVAAGYTSAELARHVATTRKASSENMDILSALISADLSRLPLPALKYADDPAYGRHFEVASQVYDPRDSSIACRQSR